MNNMQKSMAVTSIVLWLTKSMCMIEGGGSIAACTISICRHTDAQSMAASGHKCGLLDVLLVMQH